MEGFLCGLLVDTTGAGDGFVAGLFEFSLYVLGRFEGEKRFSKALIAYAARRANMVGALTTTKKGALCSTYQ